MTTEAMTAEATTAETRTAELHRAEPCARGAQTPSPTVHVQLLERLWRVAQAASRHCEAVMQETTEYSVAHFLVLRVLGRASGALAPSDVARELGCTRTNVSQLLGHLEQNEYLRKCREPGDARRVPLSLTVRGRDAYATGDRQLDAEARHVFGALEEDEKHQLFALLGKLVH